MQPSLASLMVAVFKRNSMEYTYRISSLSATQFTVKSLISRDLQWLIEIVFVVQLKTLHQIGCK